MTDETSAPQSVADEIACALTSGLSGMALYHVLNDHFPHATRDDYAFGASMAFSLHEADRIGLVHDLHQAEARIAALEARAAA